MNKTELVRALGARSRIAMPDARRIIDDVVEIILGTVASGDHVTIPGFGRFEGRAPRGSLEADGLPPRLAFSARNSPALGRRRRD